MKKYIPLIGLTVVTVIIAIWYFNRQDEYSAFLEIESDALSLVDYYIPRKIRLRPRPDEQIRKLPDFESKEPLFGSLVLGDHPDSLITVVLDETAGQSRLFIDKNNNEDLTDDGAGDWDETQAAYLIKEELLDVNYASEDEGTVPYPVVFYRHKEKLSEALVAYRNGYRKGHIILADSSYKIAVLDDDLNGLFDEFDKGAFVIDIDRDGKLDGAADSEEYYRLSEPVNIEGRAYKVSDISPSGYRIAFVPADTVLSPKTLLIPGDRAPSFKAYDIDGKVVDLTLLLDGSTVILLDFWASWCDPWQAELPILKYLHRQYNRRGLVILGISLDYDVESLKSYLLENKISWQQITTGTGWEMPLVDLYGVTALPKRFLIDRTGNIRYKDLNQKNLEAKVFELLQEPAK